MSFMVVLVVVAAAAIGAAWIFLINRRPTPHHSPPNAFILANQVTHSRYLPEDAKHSFTYPTISVLLSLEDLESGSIDLGRGLLFKYGSAFNVCGILPQSYLMDHGDMIPTGGGLPLTIRSKLDIFLKQRGREKDGISGIWIATMPSFFGFRGINPLTVYYLYKESRLWFVILEVHNTFGEKHAYVLETGVGEDAERTPNFDHQWTFPRQFHVSPFNDRSGHYRCSLNVIPSPDVMKSGCQSPRPVVKLQLLTATTPPQIKLVAVIRAAQSSPLTSKNLLSCLVRAPLALFLTLPRIVYQAFLLHYQKNLDVYPRPEPVSLLGEVEQSLGKVENSVDHVEGIGGGLEWLGESFVEKWARRRFERLLQKRAQEMNISIRIVSSQDSSREGQIYGGPQMDAKNADPDLTIYYRSSRFFVAMIMAPTPYHALLFARDAEHLVAPSSSALFLRVLESTTGSRSTSYMDKVIRSCIHSLRCWLVPPEIQTQYPILSSCSNGLDEPASPMLLLVVFLVYVTELLEKAVFAVVKARFVEDGEPWNGWRRLTTRVKTSEIGSIRRKTQ